MSAQITQKQNPEMAAEQRAGIQEAQDILDVLEVLVDAMKDDNEEARKFLGEAKERLNRLKSEGSAEDVDEFINEINEKIEELREQEAVVEKDFEGDAGEVAAEEQEQEVGAEEVEKDIEPEKPIEDGIEKAKEEAEEAEIAKQEQEGVRERIRELSQNIRAELLEIEQSAKIKFELPSDEKEQVLGFVEEKRAELEALDREEDSSSKEDRLRTILEELENKSRELKEKSDGAGIEVSEADLNRLKDELDEARRRYVEADRKINRPVVSRIKKFFGKGVDLGEAQGEFDAAKSQYEQALKIFATKSTERLEDKEKFKEGKGILIEEEAARISAEADAFRKDHPRLAFLGKKVFEDYKKIPKGRKLAYGMLLSGSGAVAVGFGGAAATGMAASAMFAKKLISSTVGVGFGSKAFLDSFVDRRAKREIKKGMKKHKPKEYRIGHGEPEEHEKAGRKVVDFLDEQIDGMNERFQKDKKLRAASSFVGVAAAGASFAIPEAIQEGFEYVSETELGQSVSEHTKKFWGSVVEMIPASVKERAAEISRGSVELGKKLVGSVEEMVSGPEEVTSRETMTGRVDEVFKEEEKVVAAEKKDQESLVSEPEESELEDAEAAPVDEEEVGVLEDEAEPIKPVGVSEPRVIIPEGMPEEEARVLQEAAMEGPVGDEDVEDFEKPEFERPVDERPEEIVLAQAQEFLGPTVEYDIFEGSSVEKELVDHLSNVMNVPRDEAKSMAHLIATDYAKEVGVSFDEFGKIPAGAVMKISDVSDPNEVKIVRISSIDDARESAVAGEGIEPSGETEAAQEGEVVDVNLETVRLAKAMTGGDLDSWNVLKGVEIGSLEEDNKYGKIYSEIVKVMGYEAQENEKVGSWLVRAATRAHEEGKIAMLEKIIKETNG